MLKNWIVHGSTARDFTVFGYWSRYAGIQIIFDIPNSFMRDIKIFNSICNFRHSCLASLSTLYNQFIQNQEQMLVSLHMPVTKTKHEIQNFYFLLFLMLQFEKRRGQTVFSFFKLQHRQKSKQGNYIFRIWYFTFGF